MSDEREKELKEVYKKGCIRLPSSFPFNGNGHAITVAPTRSGKGTRQLIPSLLFTDSNSIVVMDPKGENAAITRRFRGEISDVYLFNPWNLHDLRCDAINPFDLLDPDDPYVVDDIDLVAELIVPDESNADSHWTDRARQMIGGLMLYLIFHEPEENRHPLTLRSLLRQSADDWQAMITFMQNSSKAGGLVAEAGNELAGYGEREFASVRSTAQRATDVFKGPAMQRALTSSDVDITRLAKDQISLYLMIPADKLSTHNRITRLLIGLLMKTPIRHRGDRRVVFYLDEFASLGHLEIVETAFAQYAGYGVTLWPFVQDISQLKRHYKDGWQSLIANAEWSIFTASNDQATCELVSKLSGQHTVPSQTSGSNGKSYSDTGRALLTPDEVRRTEDIGVIMFKRGENMIYNEALTYWQMDWGARRADPNPFLGDKDAVIQKKAQAEKRREQKNEQLQDTQRRLDTFNQKSDWTWWPVIICLGILFSFLGWQVATVPEASQDIAEMNPDVMLAISVLMAGSIAIGGVISGGLYFLRRRSRKRLQGEIDQLQNELDGPSTTSKMSRQWIRGGLGWPLFTAIGLTAGHFVYLIGGTIYVNEGTWILDHIEWGGIFLREFIIFGVIWTILIGVRTIVDRKSA
jgi:type IV secretion system protein VirD4